MFAQAGPVGAAGWNHGEVERGTREHHATMLWIHGAVLRRRMKHRTAGIRHAQISIHHRAVVLAVPPAARGQIRLRIGGCRMHERHSVKRANQSQQHDGDTAAHSSDSLFERVYRSQRKCRRNCAWGSPDAKSPSHSSTISKAVVESPPAEAPVRRTRPRRMQSGEVQN